MEGILESDQTVQFMNASTLSHLVGSSQYAAFSDDALKDEDNAAWVMLLAPVVRQEWIERIGWIRLVDRLAENQLVTYGSSEFHKFCLGWQQLWQTGIVPSDCAYREVLASIGTRWVNPMPTTIDRLSVQSWERYLAALAQYHQNELVIATIAQYETMLTDLAGAFFQVLPFLPINYWQSACAFGVLDQFFNNLRDMEEDAARGVCYLPTELLERFGLTRQDILQGRAIAMSNYQLLMQFWLDEYLPHLYQKASQFIAATDLPPCWQILRDWSLQRYCRIERVFRSCHLDYRQFPSQYWAEVKRELPGLMAQAKTRTITAESIDR
jgi:phytoene synthase